MASPPLRRPHDRRALAHWFCWHGKWSYSLDISVQDASSKFDVRYGDAPVLELHPRAPPYHSPTGSSPSSSTCGNRCRSGRIVAAPACARYAVALVEHALLPWKPLIVSMPRPDGIGFCAYRDAIEAVMLGLVSIMYAIECVCRSFEHYTVQISLAHQTPFQPQVSLTAVHGGTGHVES